MTQQKIIRVLFVCMGNICRSPMAEAVFRRLVEQAGLSDRIDVESAGTGDWHAGQRPHHGTLAVLQKHQVDPGSHRARRLTRADLAAFDYIIAMDEENVTDIQQMFGRRVPRLMEFARQPATLDVPDPYYSGVFEQVYQLVLAGGQGLLEHICRENNL